jgi:uncharacterized protein
MNDNMIFWTLALIATFLVGTAKGGLPITGMLAVPMLSLVMPAGAAAGLLLPLYNVSDIYGLWIYRREFSKRNLLILIPAGALGIAIGWATARITNEDVVKLFVAVIGLAYCVDTITKAWRVVPSKPADVPRGIFWGAITGFTSFVSHSGAPPFNMYTLPQKMPKMIYAGTSTILFAAVNLMKLPPYIALGQVSFNSLQTVIWLVPLALFGAWAGYKLTQILPEKLFYRLVEAALLIVSLLLVKESLPGVWALIHR